MFKKKNAKQGYKPLKYLKLWQLIGYLLVLAVAVLCLIPNPPDTSGVSFGDKIMHMLGYFCLFLWFSQVYDRKAHYRPVIGLILLGVAIEFAQGLTSYRAFEIADMLANTGGVLLGWLVAGTFVSFILVKLESLLSPQQIS